MSSEENSLNDPYRMRFRLCPTARGRWQQLTRYDTSNTSTENRGSETVFERKRGKEGEKNEIYIDTSHGGLMTMAGVQSPVDTSITKNGPSFRPFPTTGKLNAAGACLPV